MTKERDIMFKNALAKWNWIENNWDYTLDYYENIKRMLTDLPELENYMGYCSFCDEYEEPLDSRYIDDRYPERHLACPGCPLDEIGNNCKKGNSLYRKWERGCVPFIYYVPEVIQPIDMADGIITAKKAAKKIRNLIAKLYEKELSTCHITEHDADKKPGSTGG